MLQERTRTARIEARITPEALAVIKRAAEIQGRSISDFVVAARTHVSFPLPRPLSCVHSILVRSRAPSTIRTTCTPSSTKQ